MKTLSAESGSTITLMDSFFFNITDTCFKFTELFKEDKQHIFRVDISNGLVFFDISLASKKEKVLSLKNLDRMNFIISVRHGKCRITDNITTTTFRLTENNTYLFATSRQDLEIIVESSKKAEIFILFIGDFFIKRYLSSNAYEPINFLYQKLQQDISLELVHQTPTDALSLYLIDKIIHAKNSEKMNSIISEHRSTEYMIHRFSLLDLHAPTVLSDEEIKIIAAAKQVLLQHYMHPPTIKELARQVGTNDFKLKKHFKKVYKTTVYSYIQKLRLERANLLLRESPMSVSEIANQVGYKHGGHFSAIFFKTYGVYPKDLKSSLW